jgi:hypothetical protein
MFNFKSWLEWIRNARAEAKGIRIDGVYDSFSTLVLLRMPATVWGLLPNNPAYSFVGFDTSNNRAVGWNQEPIVQCPCEVKNACPARMSVSNSHRLFMAESGEQKQSKECVQKLEQSVEDAKRGEVEARREAEYFRGREVERNASELRRQREKTPSDRAAEREGNSLSIRVKR